MDNDAIRDVSERLTLPDSIMEPGVWFQASQYASSGGDLDKMIAMLSESYVGNAAMCNLLLEWLSMVGLPTEELRLLTFNFLMGMTTNVFDPVKADAVFEQGGPPSWLEALIKHREWRPLLYALADKHPRCLLLRYAVRRIATDDGVDALATASSHAAATAAAADSVSVYGKLLVRGIANALKASPVEFSESISDVSKLALTTEATYLFTQTILSHLSNNSQQQSFASAARRVSQELHILARKSHIQFAQAVSRALENPTSSVASGGDDANAASIVTSIIAEGQTNAGDITKLHTLYAGDNPPRADILHEPLFLDALATDLFSPIKTINPAARPKFVWLLAYATSVTEGTRVNMQDKDRFIQANKSLPTVHNACSMLQYASQLTEALEILEPLVKTVPILAYCVIRWISATLSDTTRYGQSYERTTHRGYLYLLCQISDKWPLLRAHVLSAMSGAFYGASGGELDSLLVLEARNAVLDAMVHLAHTDALAVLHAGAKILQDADRSLSRHFGSQFITRAQPPFTEEFIAALTKVLAIATPLGWKAADEDVRSSGVSQSAETQSVIDGIVTALSP